jgi:hypothetical protein
VNIRVNKQEPNFNQFFIIKNCDASIGRVIFMIFLSLDLVNIRVNKQKPNFNQFLIITNCDVSIGRVIFIIFINHITFIKVYL